MILVVGAIGQELAGARRRARLLACGVGPVESAIATAKEIIKQRPQAVINVGLAGARRGSGVEVLDVVVGTEAVYCDLFPRFSPNVLRADEALLEAARAALPEARFLPVGTTARVGGSTGVDVEAMEGFAVMRAAQLAAIPAIELRVISNEIEEPTRASWRVDDGLFVLTGVLRRLLDALG
jgi:nucleoside phosphorylase